LPASLNENVQTEGKTTVTVGNSPPRRFADSMHCRTSYAIAWNSPAGAGGPRRQTRPASPHMGQQFVNVFTKCQKPGSRSLIQFVAECFQLWLIWTHAPIGVSMSRYSALADELLEGLTFQPMSEWVGSA
jgi:hypothetical protein